MGYTLGVAVVVTALSIVPAAIATEIEGKVATVVDQLITISSQSDLLPEVGDQLRIFVEIPGVGRASVASATISSIHDDVIQATIDTATGTVRMGQIAIIDSPHPTRKHQPRAGSVGWGTLIDPDGDCSIEEQADKLTIRLSARQHSLWYGRGGLFNAPRALQRVSGDFVAQVKVTADMDTGVRLPDMFFNSAGLVVWESEKQYLRLERNWFNNPNYGTISFITPLYDHEDTRINGWKTASPNFFSGPSTWLRIERSGARFTTYVSHDGAEWSCTGVMTTEFPDDVQVGVLALNRPRAFTAEFEDFSIQRGPPASIVATPSIPIEGWGNIIDPDDGCRVAATPNLLRIYVTPGVYDLWYGREDPAKRYNSPRVLQEIEGDFEMQVKVTAEWEGPAVENGSFSRAAGLLVYESDQHYLRHERNRFISPRRPDVAWSWTPPLYDRNEQRISQWKSARDGPFQGNSTWLRMKRSGQQITTWISHNGTSWIQTGTHTTTFPAKVQVGIIAHSKGAADFMATFEEFNLTRN